MSCAINLYFPYVGTSLWPTGVGRQRNCSLGYKQELNNPVLCCQPQQAMVTEDLSTWKVSYSEIRALVPNAESDARGHQPCALCPVLPSGPLPFSFHQNTNPLSQCIQQDVLEDIMRHWNDEGPMGEFYNQRSLENALEDLYAHYYIKVSEKSHSKELFYFIYFCGSEPLPFYYSY